MTIDWIIDNTETIAGHSVRKEGKPGLIEASPGPALQFDGRGDGLFVPINPLAGLQTFTIEVIFMPEDGGSAEQRFFHSGTVDSDRFLFETRYDGKGNWYLDTYLESGSSNQALMSDTHLHPIGGWFAVAATIDRSGMASFVNQKQELACKIATETATAGNTSLGVRQDLRSWFKGAIARVRVTDRVLEPAEMLIAQDP